MPQSAPHPCTYPGCGNLVRSSARCPEHPLQVIRSAEVQRLYGRQWQARRQAWLTQSPWCVDCLQQGIYTPATDVDHIRPHHGDPVSFWTGELQSLCKSCHSTKTLKELRGEI